MKTGYDLRDLGPVLEKQTIIGHNLLFDLLWLRLKCHILPTSVYCTMTASRLLTAGSTDANRLEVVVERHLKFRLQKDLGNSDWGAVELSPEQIRYCVGDVRHLHPLRSKLVAAIEAGGLAQVSSLEMRLIPAVIKMEVAGVPVDRSVLLGIKSSALDNKDRLTTELRAFFENPDLNPSSPKQMLASMVDIGLDVKNTSAETLSGVNHEAARLLLALRAEEAMYKMARGLEDSISVDERIHATFNTTGTKTGRFSCKEPNLQNVTRGTIRRAFRAPDGCSLIVADYSQIELRAIASIANDGIMLQAFANNEDLHRKTAALVLKKSEAEITAEERQIAKAVNFGLIYGQSAQGLVKYAKQTFEVSISLQEAGKMRQRFFESYRGIQAFHDAAWKKARRGTGPEAYFARTLDNRRQTLPRGDDKEWQRFAGFVNTPVQGSCGDGIKHAMVLIDSLLPDSVQMIATIHDELIFVTPTREAEAIKELVVNQMKVAMSRLFPAVPIEVEAKICYNWAEK